MENSERNIYQRMLMVQSEMEDVVKSFSVSKKGESYKALSEKDVLEAVKPLEQKYGIKSFPAEREIMPVPEMSGTFMNGKVIVAVRMKTIYRFVNVDNPSDYAETMTFAEGFDTFDKACGKASTYCDKYALMKMYKITTCEDDPDAVASPELKRNCSNDTKPDVKAETSEKKPAASVPATEETKPENRSAVKMATPEQEKALRELLTPIRFKRMLASAEVDAFDKLTYAKADEFLQMVRNQQKKK